MPHLRVVVIKPVKVGYLQMAEVVGSRQNLYSVTQEIAVNSNANGVWRFLCVAFCDAGSEDEISHFGRSRSKVIVHVPEEIQ